MALAQTILEEYKAIRAEITQSLESRVNILSFGFAAVVALLAGGVAALSSEKKKQWFVSAMLIGVGATMTSFFVIDAWKVETQRLQRASYHNYYLELKLSRLFPGDIAPLEWEQRVRTDLYYKSLIPYDSGTPWIFIIFAIISAAGGSFLFWQGAKDHPSLHGWRIPVILLATLLTLYGSFCDGMSLYRLNQRWNSTPSPTPLLKPS